MTINSSGTELLPFLVQWGIDHEAEAKEEYLLLLKKPYTKTLKYIHQELHCTQHTNFLEPQLMARLLKMKT